MGERGEDCEIFVVKAIDNFKPTNKSDLSFKKGQVIFVERKDGTDNYFGYYNAGKSEGWFPAFYVTTTKDIKIEPRKVKRVIFNIFCGGDIKSRKPTFGFA